MKGAATFHQGSFLKDCAGDYQSEIFEEDVEEEVSTAGDHQKEHLKRKQPNF